MTNLQTQKKTCRKGSPDSRKNLWPLLVSGMLIFAILAVVPVAAATPTSTQSYGRIQAFIQPYGGQICIDGGHCEDLGSVNNASMTSIQFKDLTANQYHTLTITMDGYQTRSQMIYVTPDETTEVKIKMYPKAS